MKPESGQGAARGLAETKYDLAELKLWMTTEQIAKGERLARGFNPSKTPE